MYWNIKLAAYPDLCFALKQSLNFFDKEAMTACRLYAHVDRCRGMVATSTRGNLYSKGHFIYIVDLHIEFVFRFSKNLQNSTLDFFTCKV
jgi:hypothetical protein